MAANDAAFIELVQEHERTWGTENYPGRPTLAELLNAPIVVWWIPVKEDDNRRMATVHKDLEELNKYATRLLVHSRTQLPDRRLVSIHVNQKRAVIRGVSLKISPADDER